MTHQMQPRYMVTADEMAASFHIYQPRVFAGSVERKDVQGVPMPSPLFDLDGEPLPKRPLEGTPYTFQVGISPENPNVSFREWLDRCEIQHVRGRNSGVVVLDGDEVIAGYTAGLNHRRPGWLIAVNSQGKRRGQGLSKLAIAEWFKAAPYLNLVGWPVTPLAAKSFIGAHKIYLRHAIATLPAGTVPQNVIDSVQE